VEESEQTLEQNKKLEDEAALILLDPSERPSTPRAYAWKPIRTGRRLSLKLGAVPGNAPTDQTIKADSVAFRENLLFEVK